MTGKHRLGTIGKNDTHAREYWGACYDEIPKSVFATVAWHLANLCSGSCDADGAAEARAIKEIRILNLSRIIPERQANQAAKAIAKAHPAAAQWQQPADD